MCFSAAASFTGGAVLTLLGAATIRKNSEPDQRLFAAMPLVFGVQQISEGFVWLALQSPGQDLLLKLSIYTFLAAALVIWPAFVPLSILLGEFSIKRRRMIYALLAAGVAVSVYYGVGLFTESVSAQINGYHILYSVGSPSRLVDSVNAAYLVATILPMFVASRRRAALLGVVIVIAYAVAFFFYREYLVSVWCFFSAIASAVVLWVVSDVKSRQQVPVIPAM